MQKKTPLLPWLFVLVAVLARPIGSAAQTLSVDASAPPAPATEAVWRMGASRNPQGHEISADSTSLLRDGKPWFAVSGEFHFSRCPANEWRDELLKMKAGGVDVVSTYVFWIHHEETQGKWDWTGQRSLRDFVALCQSLDLPVILRIGPWCHGEVRNGGFPDWMLNKGFKVRTDDPNYLAEVQLWYAQIAGQVQGLLWKDGGPVIGIQLDNEFGGQAEHLLNLKQIARSAGLDVPLYTRTGWPSLKTPMPFGEMLPLFGSYSEGFWDLKPEPMMSKYWQAFSFKPDRIDAAVGTDQLGQREKKDEGDAARYPYLLCELGGGMETSYHRRILVPPAEVASVALVRLGSGANMLGYYMYHGGINPDGELTTLQESLDSKYPNDLPVKSYDFQAPIGSFGQLRPHYHMLRRLHMFLHDFGASLTTMRPVFPTPAPTSERDSQTVRWSVRTDGKSGYLFVNNYQRLLPMPARPRVQFEVRLGSGKVLIPKDPIDVPPDSSFFWPFNLDLDGTKLIYATAQPICKLEDRNTLYVFFAQTPGVASDFVLEGGLQYHNVQPGTGPAVRFPSKGGKNVCLVLLSNAMSLQCWKGVLAGQERVFLTRAALLIGTDKLRLSAIDPADMNLAMLPSEVGSPDGVFRRFGVSLPRAEPIKATVEQLKQPGPSRKIPIVGRGVAAAPTEADFEQGGSWRVKLPLGAQMLRINYVGDAARLSLNGKFLNDNFYNGNAFDVGLSQYADNVNGEFVLKILPLRRDAPIYLPRQAIPDFAGQQSVVKLKSVEVIQKYQAYIAPR